MNATLPIWRPARMRDWDLPREIITGFRFELEKDILSHGVNATPGAYFVTVCCQKRNPYFDFPPAKAMVEKWWFELANKFPSIELDQYVVMPDHFHGIISILPPVGEGLCALPSRRDEMVDYSESPVGEGLCALIPREDGMVDYSANGSTRRCSPTKMETKTESRGLNSVSLIEKIRWFKTMTTNEYTRMVKTANWPPYFKKMWQRSFYDHVIRNDEDLRTLRDYILNNPLELNLVEESAK